MEKKTKKGYRDSLGDRMKECYEDRFRFKIARRTYTLIRVDGKAFHTYTKGLKRPFDDGFMRAMDLTAIKLCEEVQGAVCAFVQSDEISVLFADILDEKSQMWFDGNLQKIVSVSAAIATSTFNEAMIQVWLDAKSNNILSKDSIKIAMFDSRVCQISQKREVANYFIWRQNDTVRNSISSVAQSKFSHKELEGKDCNAMQEMMFQKDATNWNDFAPRYKRGRLIVKKEIQFDGVAPKFEPYTRNKWVVVEPPIFTQEPEFLMNLIPDNK